MSAPSIPERCTRCPTRLGPDNAVRIPATAAHASMWLCWFCYQAWQSWCMANLPQGQQPVRVNGQWTTWANARELLAYDGDRADVRTSLSEK